MTDFEGKTMYCRSTEEKILNAWKDRKNKKISIRDSVKIGADDSIRYRLWNTDLVIKFKNDDNIYINISSNQEEIDRYCSGWNYARRDYIISNTTKSRLNAFLYYYGFHGLEVHSSVKDWSVKYDGEELEVDSLYKLDFINKRLVKVEQ